MGVWYATREDVQRALDSKLTARNSAQIDRALESVSRDIESLCHRLFYPETATLSWDWPDSQQGTSWRLWLDERELISVTTLSSGGTTIAASSFNLEPNRTGPPYNQIQLKLSTSAAFGGGSTHQRDVTVTGLFGYRNDETAAGTLAAAVSSTTATTVSVNGAAAAALGVGSVIRVDSERMLVTSRTMTTTSQTLGGTINEQLKTVTVAVTDGTAYAVDEVILIDSERMLIVDIAGNNLTVKRAWDGSPNASHTAGATIYALRTLTVTRGALGTTAATHSNGATVQRWDPPGPVRDLTIAEAVAQLTNEQAGYARTRKSGDGGTSERAMDATALASLRDRVYASHGRKGRVRAV